MKLNWGHYLAIAMLSFMVFILSFVYNTFTKDSYDHHLVSKEYYLDEINYQQEIEAIDNANKLPNNVHIQNNEQGILLVFPNLPNLEGTVEFQRPSNPKLDISTTITINDGVMQISKEKLIKGLYHVRINWVSNDVAYLFKDKHFY